MPIIPSGIDHDGCAGSVRGERSWLAGEVEDVASVRTKGLAVRILDERQEALVQRERDLLGNLARFLTAFGAPPSDARLVKETIFDMRELFLLVIVGEFNAGKSAFANAFLGEELSPEGITPTTDKVTILRYNPRPTETDRRDGVLERGYPNPVLKAVSIVDTPGTNAVMRHHEELSHGFVPRSDLVLFVTSADRPFTESERAYLEIIRSWGKKIVLVVNKVDLLEESDKAKVRSYVEELASALLGFTPPMFLVSSRAAMRAKLAGTRLERYHHMQTSGFGSLERHIYELLHDEERVRLKLTSPLGVVSNLAERYQLAVNERTLLLEEDLRMCREVEEQLAQHLKEMREDFAGRMSMVDGVIRTINERAEAWFEENIQLSNSVELLQREKVQERFRTEVVADNDKLVDESVRDLINWLVDRNLRQWSGIVEYLDARRHAEYDGELAGEIDDDFEYYRDQLLISVGDNATNIVRNYDPDHESDKLAVSLRSAVAQTAAAELGALGLGGTVTALGFTLAFDITGITAAVLFAGMGLFILPNRRNKARSEFTEKTEELRERLTAVLKLQLEVELEESVRRMREAIAPYTEFVRSEHGRMHDARIGLKELDRQAQTLREEIDAHIIAPASRI